MTQSSQGIQEAINAYLTAAQERGLSAITVESYRYDLKRFAEHVAKEPAQVTIQEIKSFLMKDSHQRDATRHRHFSSLNSFYRWLVREDIVACNPLERLKPAPPPRRHPRPLAHESTMRILQVIPPEALRDRTLFTLLYETGLRVGEVLNIRTSDLDLIAGSESLRIWSNKMRSERIFPLIMAPASVQLLHQYVKGLQKGPLFPGRQLSGNRYVPLKYSAVHVGWKKYCRAAGITATLQQLRDSRIRIFLKVGLSTPAIQQYLGHRSPLRLEYYLPTPPEPALLFEQAREYEHRLAKENWALESPTLVEEDVPRQVGRRLKRPRK